jgi:hypothetical protein
MTSDKDSTKSQAAPKAASTSSEGNTKPEASTPANYTRGEKQKPVTDTYKKNWNRIYGKKKGRSR